MIAQNAWAYFFCCPRFEISQPEGATTDPDQPVQPVEEGLKKASGFLRSKLGHELQIRHVPELRFKHDDSAEESVRISQLINSALHAIDSE